MTKILLYGDSISSGTHGDGAYHSYLERMLDSKITNRSIGSSGLTKATPNSMMEQLEKFGDDDYDIVLIWHGTNDWYWGSELKTFKSDMEEAIEIIRKRNPFSEIVWVSPIFREEAPYGTTEKKEANFAPNKAGATLLDYVAVIKEVSIEKHVRFFDLDSLVQITKYNSEIFLEDGVHPNKLGYERIARALYWELKCILFMKEGMN